MTPTSTIQPLLDSCSWASGLDELIGALPQLLDGPPPLLAMPGAGDDPVVLAPCAAELVEPTAQLLVTLVDATLVGAAPDSPAEQVLIGRLAALVVEASGPTLSVGAVPGLALAAVALQAVQGDRGVLSLLPRTLQERVHAMRRALVLAPPVLAGRVLRVASTGLSTVLRRALDRVGHLGPEPAGARLAVGMLGDGLLLGLGPQGPESEADATMALAALGLEEGCVPVCEVFADLRAPAQGTRAQVQRALRRWSVSRALADRVSLLYPTRGGWVGPLGMLPADPRGLLMVPRGGRPQKAAVVAVRLDALETEVEAAGCSPLVYVEPAWQVLVAQAPEALLSRHGALGLAVFTDVMAALAFADRATRTLSGPRVLDDESLGTRCEVGPLGRVSAGLAFGPLWGGTDGIGLAIDGTVVGRAIALACSRPQGLEVVAAMDCEPGAGVHIGALACTALLSAAAKEGRAVVDGRARMAPPMGDLPIRGWWEHKGRRMVLFGTTSVGLLDMEREQLDAMLARAQGEAGDTSLLAALEGFDWRAGSPEAVDADPLHEPTFDEDLVLVDPASPAFSLVMMDTEEEEEQEAEGAGGEGYDGNSKEEAPLAWDATGLSLPAFSQDRQSVEDLARLMGQEHAPVQHYSLEVDDDYGFEDEDGQSGPIDPMALDEDSGVHALAFVHSSVSADTGVLVEPPPGRHGGELTAEDFDVFAFPGASAAAGRGMARATASDMPSSEDVFALPRGDDSTSFFDIGRRPPPEADRGALTPFPAVEEADVAVCEERGEEGGEERGEEGEDSAALHTAGPTEPAKPARASDGGSSGGALRPFATDPSSGGSPLREVHATLSAMTPSAMTPSAMTPGGGASGGGVGGASDPEASGGAPEVEPRRRAGVVGAWELASLFGGYVVVTDDFGCLTFGLRDGSQLRDAHSYETGGDPEAAYRAFVQAKVAEGFVPRLDLWSPMPAEGVPQPLDPALLERAYSSMLTE